VTLSSRLTGISAFFLSVALFYAPLAYGCTREDMLPTLYLLLALSIAAGLAGLVLRGIWPDIPKTALLCFAGVMFQGWFMVADPVLPPMVPDNGGLIDTSIENLTLLSFNAMLLVTLTLCTFLLLCDTLVDPGWRRFVLMSAAVSGALVALVGVFLKTSLGAPLMARIWGPGEVDWNEFAFFHYHGSAGAFLNLAWPLILVFTRRAYEVKEIRLPVRIIWTTASFVCGLALFLNASKAALAIGLLILPWPFATGLKRMESKQFFALAVLSVILLAVMLTATSHLAKEAAFKRMTNANDVSESLGGRWDAYGQYLDDVPEAGWFGIGPGLFEVGYPYQNISFRNYDPVVRQYAHEDFLQTTLEWGWLGTVWWTLLVAGGLWRAFHAYAQRERFQSRTDRHLVLACILGVLGALTHALFDFPLQVPSIRLFFLLELALCWAAPALLAPLPGTVRPVAHPFPIPPPDVDEEGRLTVQTP
jgi:O-antigen ligase